MTENPILHGIVLSSMPVGEYDRRLSSLTKERGRISAFARGAQRPKSALVAAAQPFVTGAFTVVDGRSSYTMIRAEVNEYFTELRGDLAKTCYACYFCVRPGKGAVAVQHRRCLFSAGGICRTSADCKS